MTSVYKIGVNLAMTSNGAQVLSLLSKHLLGVHAKVDQLQGGMNRLKLAIGGAFAIAGGVAILGAFKAPIEETMKWETALARFRQFGLGDKLNADAERFAKSMHVAGANFTDAINTMAEAQGVFRESGLNGPAALAGAELAAPMLAKISFANHALHPDQAGQMDASSLAMLRFVEMRGGLQSAQRFNQIADLGFKAIQSSSRGVSWEQLRQFMARGGVAAQGIRDDVLLGKLEPVIGELKGSTAGKSWMTAYNRLQGIVRVPNQVAHELATSGVWDPSKIVWNAMGGIKSFNGNPLRNAAEWQTDPVAAYQKYILPMYGRMGLDQNGRYRENALIFGGTGGNFFSMIDKQQNPIANSVNAQFKAMGVDKAYQTARETTYGRWIAVQKQFSDLMITFGSAVLPLVNKALGALLPPLTALSDWMLKHTAIVKGVAIGVAILGAGLVAAGAVAIAIAAGPIALWTAGIAALGAVVTGFLVAAWEPLKRFWDQFSTWIISAGKIIADVVTGNLPAAARDAWDAFHHEATPAKGFPGAKAAPQQPGDVYLYGRKVGHVMIPYLTKQQADILGPLGSGVSRFDPSATWPSPAGVFSR